MLNDMVYQKTAENRPACSRCRDVQAFRYLHTNEGLLKNISSLSLEETLEYYYHAALGESLQGSPVVAW